MRDILLAGKLDTTRWINANPTRMDEGAVEFTCDLLAAACICDTIRSHDRKVKEYPTRVYLRRAAAWQRLPNDAVLSVVEDEQVKLNPVIFPEEIVPVEFVPPNAPEVL